MKRVFILIILNCLSLLSAYDEIEKIVILGSGPAGLTSAIFAGQAHLTPLVIKGNEHGNPMQTIYKMENFPGFPEGISGEELTERLHQQAEIFGARFHPGTVVSIDLDNRPFYITLSDNSEIYTESLVIATGASPVNLNVPGEKELLGNGVSMNAYQDAPLFQDKNVIVVGGGDAALEQAAFLAQQAKKVTLIYKKGQLSGTAYLQQRVFENPKIEVLLNTEVVDIRNATLSYVTAVSLRNILTNVIFSFPCEGVFIANGRKPNTDLFKGQLEMTERGYIITTPGSTKTTLPGVFAAGDIVQNSYGKAITAAATGGMAALDAAAFLKNTN